MSTKQIKKNNELWINSINQEYLDNLYKKYLKDENSLDMLWRKKFKKLNLYFLNKNNDYNIQNNKINFKNNYMKSKFHILNQKKIFKILNFFRKKGYKYSNINPLENLKYQKEITKINHDFFKISDKKLYEEIILNINKNKIKNFSNFFSFLSWLKKKYCHTIGFEFNHLSIKKEKLWCIDYIERKWNKNIYTKNKKLNILNAIIYSETFENYINSKYPGYKRFSLEGNDSLIPMLYEAIICSIKNKIKNLYIGMAHRGRLNVLTNILGKPTKKLFQEFSKNFTNSINTGDVKYHFGFYSKAITKHGSAYLNLEYNPSHLEIINPVIMGISRSCIDSLQSSKKNKVLSIMIHGDAALIGQGVIQETLNMSQTPGYTVGGSVHIVINNQIGFTTSNINHMRSSNYCTDIAKMIESPIFHVNADDPEAAVFAIQMAIKYKKKFKKDVFIDLIGYRRYGHNESDEPSVTQPLMYQKIKNHPTVKNIYFKKLLKKKIITKNKILKIILNYQKQLDNKLSISPNYSSLNFELKSNYNKIQDLSLNLKKIKFSKNKLLKLFKDINTLPKKLNIHPLVKKIYINRMYMVKKEKYIDWGAAENLAYAYLLNIGISCRISGEDVIRGTFFHRHAKIYDQKNNNSYTPLKNVSNGKFFIWNSVLSEESVLAFEYGYSLRNCNTLNVWEAQFGDFSNVAQVVIDQFITSSKEKWNQSSGIVMFLPHGYEGQGPEHSSARIERYLQLCAKKNIQVCIPTTSSQIFHLLCLHALTGMKKPLIIFSPKSLLRNPLSQSSFKELYLGKFKQVIYKNSSFNSEKINKIILCCGKIYYELLEIHNKNKMSSILFIKIEQLYPFPTKQILKIFKNYSYVKNIFWYQEEPKNQGAWNYIKNIFSKIFSNNIKITYVGRYSSASPATGNIYIHKKEQFKIINSIFKKY
ncbi:2-oxoglutarate dehydrogenase E1 component [Buchnera aphidicola]|uniref:2-oxoglutarate dehydrogenase E1 component n=1 Tax=Buchnera aphidicola TaxID=9 RepID=UPI00223748BA|nr:2-oxoglutarate dehydrogenase E1 component [Buchnera aphidicola]MCW5197704.1 2-oxoglutarate dehydrogenase E1 component [Buchnera aphidicola (Chaitophorus viminalis)]